MKRMITAVLLTFSISAPADATGFFAGIKTGWAGYSVGGKRESTSVLGVLGGYTLTPYIMVEAEYINLGSIFFNSAKISALSLSTVGYYPIQPQLALFGKLGVANTSEKALGLTSRRTAATLGFGAHFILDDAIQLRFGWERYNFGGDQGFVKGKANLYSVAGIYRF